MTTATTKPAAAAKKTTPTKKAVAKPDDVKAAPITNDNTTKTDAETKGKPVKASTDPNHQQWQIVKRDITAAMSDLLYDSRRVNPGYAKNQAEATAKVTAALKVLSEFVESIRLKD